MQQSLGPGRNRGPPQCLDTQDGLGSPEHRVDGGTDRTQLGVESLNARVLHCQGRTTMKTAGNLRVDHRY